MKSTIIEIQIYRSKNGFYESLRLGKLGNKAIVVGGDFQILVDGKVIFKKVGKED